MTFIIIIIYTFIIYNYFSVLKEKFFYTTNISNMKGRIKMKKLLSLLLSLSMLASMAVIPAKAEETVMPLNASRIDSEKLPSGNLIYLGTA